MTRRAFIRPRYRIIQTLEGDHEELRGYSLCTTNGELLIDEQILEHFPVEETGVQMKAAALEFFGREAEWGKPLRED